jgi:D-methionine transport system substrate-binding protein
VNAIMKKRVLIVVSLFILGLGLAACNHKSSQAHTIKVGTIAGPESDLMMVAKHVAKKRYNLDVEIVLFTDYTMPNEALDSGSIDVNMFQHRPYLASQVKERGYKIEVLGNSFVYPMAVYSKNANTLTDLPIGAKVCIPNDPSNEARALLLLADQKLITLNTSLDKMVGLADIKSNPKNIHFIEMDVAQLPRSLDDVQAAVITNTYAVTAGLHLRDAIAKENGQSPYVNVFVIRSADMNKPELKELLVAFQSEPVLVKANALFGEGAIAGFTPTPAPE